MATGVQQSPSSSDRSAQILRVVFIALLIDIFAFTIILPLLPRLLEQYRLENKDGLFGHTLSLIQWFKEAIGAKGKKLDIILFGGFLGSLFSFLQFMVSPAIGYLSDTYGRKTVLLYSMIGNIISAALWLVASDFETFVLSRVTAGLSEGNVQISTAIIADVTTPETRSRGLALIGIAFALGFTFGPATGAYFSSFDLSETFPQLRSAGFNAYSSPALLVLLVLLIEVLYLWLQLDETNIGNHNSSSTKNEKSDKESKSDIKTDDAKKQSHPIIKKEPVILDLQASHFAFLFLFSGMEFTLTFLCFERLEFTNMQQGRLLGFVGVTSALLQGGYVRRFAHRVGEKRMVRHGILSCMAALLILAFATTEPVFYLGAFFLAFTSATVVNCLTSLVSLRFNNDARKGEYLGRFRSAGQLGRALGPIFTCALYWVLGSSTCYAVGGVAMILPYLLVTFSSPNNPSSDGQSRNEKIE